MRSHYKRAFARAVVACLLATGLSLPLFAQADLFISNATVITGLGETIENASIYIKDGKIMEIGEGISPPSGVRVIDATGHFAMPGIIDQHSHLGAAAINEGTSQNSAMVDITDVVVHDDYGMYRALASGVTTIHVLHGSANVIGGRDEVYKLKWGRDREEILVKGNKEGLKFALGENPIRGDERYPNSRMGIEHILRNEFNRALEYKRAWEEYELKKKGEIKPANDFERDMGPVPPKRDIQLEVLVGVLEGKTRSHIHAYSNQEISMFNRIAAEFGIKPTSYEHVLEGYMVADEMAQAGSVASIFADSWNYKVEASLTIPFAAALMHERGVVVSINSDSGERIRRLQLDAAKTIRYGNMPETEAFKTIGYNAAYGIWLHDRIGSLKVGLDGDVAIFDGHPLSVFSKCVKTIIEGEVFFDRNETLTTEKWLRGEKPQMSSGDEK